MKNKDNFDIEKALTNEIIGDGFREMKNRFAQISEEIKKDSVFSIINKLPAAAFGGFAKVASSPLPVTDKTLKEFLEEDNKMQITNKKSTPSTRKKKSKNK